MQTLYLHEEESIFAHDPMNTNRREFLKSFAGGVSLLALDRNSFPTGSRIRGEPHKFDAVIIGSGLGGLSCAAAFARQGFTPVVLEKHDRPGGYATTFTRPGGFVFDVSLHSTSVGENERLHDLIPGFPEIDGIEFIPHPTLYRAIYPDYDIRVPQRDLPGYLNLLTAHFPDDREGITRLVEEMKGLRADLGRLAGNNASVHMNRFPQDYPFAYNYAGKTWGEMMGTQVKNLRLQAILSALWTYYGLPPSKLSALFYALPTLGYLEQGGYYIKGRSQKLSNALVGYIEEKGGKVLLTKRATRILTKDHSAYGVQCDDGSEFTGRVVISNADAFNTFHRLLGEGDNTKEYLATLDRFSISLSSFQIFLGLKKDLVGELGMKDSEIFYETGYDPDQSYLSALNANVDEGSYIVTLYDNLYKGYSPPGKNTLTIMTLQGYDHWKRFEADYFRGNKREYRIEKERMAERLIGNVEKTLMPGLSAAIEVKEIGTPLTNVRYTGNYRGAIYGWNQTVDNSGEARLPHNTPIRNLYLVGAWTRPGHGYGGVLSSGLECFGQIMREW